MTYRKSSVQMLTRRELTASISIAVAGAASSRRAWAAVEDEISRSAESIHQEPVFKTSVRHLYEILTDAGQFQKIVQLSGAMQAGALQKKPAEIGRQAGDAFSIFGGHIAGRQLELTPNVRIVQAWRVVDWEPGIYSIARFQLAEQSSSAKIILDHTGFPKGQAEHLAEGWKENYWQPLEKFLARS